MKWVLLAILLAVVPYTFVTLRYRKEGPAFQPYADMKDRANVTRLLSAGYRRIPLVAQRPADDTRPAGGAAVTPYAGGLPGDLRTTLVETPHLPSGISDVAAAPSANRLLGYPIRFTCTLADDKLHLGGADLYLRENVAVLVPTFEPVAGDLLTRSRHAVVQVAIPAGTLNPGQHKFILVASTASRLWQVDVQ